MDNLCHTLAGLAIAESGVTPARRGVLVMAAVAANAPDLDALAALDGYGVGALAFRRGITHGVLAMVLLPLAIGGVTWWLGRRQDDFRRLLLLAGLAVWSHSFLDWLNSYGIRLLAPFDWRWFHGDAVFIIDPWLWLALGTAAVVAWRRRRRGQAEHGMHAARVGLGIAGVYVLAMLATSAAGRWLVERTARATGDSQARRTMAGPMPATPFRREVIRDLGDRYQVGTLTLLPTPRYQAVAEYPSRAADAPALAAASTPDGRAFLSWSRFPVFRWEREAPVRVRIFDLRYSDGDGAGRGWASVDVDLSDGGAAPPGKGR